MRKLILFVVAMTLSTVLHAQEFDSYFKDATLRIDYTLMGNAKEQHIALRDMSATEKWWGRRVNLDEVPLLGNGDLTLTTQDGKVIYKTSFSTLFQEWITTPEAATITKSFEHTLLVPMPQQKCVATLVLRDNEGRQSKHSFTLNPDDALIRDNSNTEPLPWSYVYKQGGDSKECIDVVILAEGYRAEEMDLFLEDAVVTAKEILNYEPFKSHSDKFNFIAVCSESKHSNVSEPHKDAWRDTAIGSNFMTFYMPRYLTAGNVYDIYDLVTNIPCEHIIILANTDTYGGGGIYNSYTLTTAHHRDFKSVVVHEFGHSFGGLGDEYFYATTDNNDAMHSLSHEPWEPNITTLVDFDSKWADMVAEGVEIPTTVTEERTANYTIGVYEGGGYRAKGIYRPADVCRMRNNTADRFCAVCQRAIERVILHQTVEGR